MKYSIFILLLLSLSWTSCEQSKAKEAGLNNTASVAAADISGSSWEGELKTKADSISYAIGLNVAQAYQSQQVDFNPEVLIRGVYAAMGKEEQALSDADIQQVIMRFQMEMRQRQVKQQLQAQKGPRSNIKDGQQAPEITLATPAGGTLSLSDLRGKYVLVDFWASWCKPCRVENPNVVRMYNKYKDKGFEILGVSLDRNKDQWLAAIQQDGLTWKHISDLKFWSSAAAQTYGVGSIPYTVLVDPQGKVIAQNLRGPSLEAKLAELLGT